jgi:hypothetical protein
MSEINHFKLFVLFSDDMVMIEQLRWIAHMLKGLVNVDSFI